jgi:hypothetical protein
MERTTQTDGRKIGILVYELKSESGESRQAVNFALGLKRRGLTPTIFSIAATPELRERCRVLGLSVRFRRDSLGTFDALDLMLYGRRLASKLVALTRLDPPCEDYVVMQDAAVPVVDRNLRGTLTYFCCGDMILLLLNGEFRRARGVVSSLLSLAFVRTLNRHAQLGDALCCIVYHQMQPVPD